MITVRLIRTWRFPVLGGLPDHQVQILWAIGRFWIWRGTNKNMGRVYTEYKAVFVHIEMIITLLVRIIGAPK